jgi:hypothetical protein
MAVVHVFTRRRYPLYCRAARSTVGTPTARIGGSSSSGPRPTRHGPSRNPQMQIKENRHVTDLFAMRRVEVGASNMTAMTNDDVIHERDIIRAVVLVYS